KTDTRVVACRCAHDLRRQQRGFDCGTDPFAASRIGQAGRIADQQYAIVVLPALGLRVEHVRVTVEPLRHVARSAAALAQPGAELRHVLGQPVAVLAAQADVEIACLGNAPAVALEVGAEIKLRRVLLDAAVAALAVAEGKFRFLRDDNGLPLLSCRAQHARYRAEMPAGADHEWSPDAVVYEPGAVFAGDTAHGLAKGEARPRALQQVMVEFATPDAEARRGLVAHRRCGPADGADAKAADRLQHALARILVKIEFQRRHCGRRDPAGAHLVAREFLLVDDEYIEACPAQLPRAGGSRRTAADDQDITSRGRHRP